MKTRDILKYASASVVVLALAASLLLTYSLTRAQDKVESDDLARFVVLMQYIRSQPTPADVETANIPSLTTLDNFLSDIYITGFITPYIGETSDQVKARLQSTPEKDRFTAVMVESYRLSPNPLLLDMIHQLLPLYYVKFFTTAEDLNASEEFLKRDDIQSPAAAFDSTGYAIRAPTTTQMPGVASPSARPASAVESDDLARFVVLMQYIRSQPTPADVETAKIPSLTTLDNALSDIYITGFITPYTGETSDQVKARLQSIPAENRFTAVMVESYRLSPNPLLLDMIHQLLPLYYVKFFTTAEDLNASEEFLKRDDIQTLADAFDPTNYATQTLSAPLTPTATPSPTPAPTGDRAALVALYNATDGPNWTNSANWLSDRHIRDWYGVTTDRNGRVTEIELRDNGLIGELPDEFRMLTRLKVLNLGSNQIIGPLPAWVGELSHLRRLLLDRNVFTGELPPELGDLSRLEDLTLDGSAGFFGKLPEALTKLDRLHRLTFYRTALCAPLEEGFQTWLNGISEWRGWDCPPGAKDLPAPAEVPYPIVTREQGYGYTIDIPDDWVDRGNYFDSVPHGRLFVREHHLHAETTLEQFAESVRDDLERQLSASAFVFEITSFEKSQSVVPDSYIIEYHLQGGPDYCMEDIIERIALGSSLPGPPKGYRLRHRVCNSVLSRELDRARRETLDSFSIVTNADAYYNQFISRPGVLIKAPGKVDPEALRKAAQILDVMLDGRPDIPDCLGRIGSALAIVADGDPLTALPEHAFRTNRGSYVNSLHAPGSGGTPHSPVTATPEQMLRGFAAYPPFRDVHEPGHHLQLCFTESDNWKWEALYQDAVERVGTINDPIDRLIDHNDMEFWAGFASFYFHRHYAPRRYAEHLYPEAFAFVESVYGKLTPTESDHPGYTQYVTASGHKLPWLVPGDVTYEDDTFGYMMDLLPGWVVKKESANELLLVSRNWPWPVIRVHYTRLPGGVNADDTLVRLSESRRKDWERKTRRWHSSEVRLFERESLDGHDTYWIHLYGQESPGDYELAVVERVLVATHGGRNYGVILEGIACGEGSACSEGRAWGGGNEYAVRDFEIMLRSFILPTSERAPTPEATPAPAPETDAAEIAGLERAALEALYNSTGGERWNRSENWLSDKPLDKWYGVRTVGGRVTKLFLNDNGLRGRIPAELESLTYLRELWLGDNNLTGELPSELSNLARLKVLDVSNAEMSGPIPAWLGELGRLRKLYLRGNQFSSPLPQSLTRITGLKRFYFGDNSGLCAPTDPTFMAWLQPIDSWGGPDCEQVKAIASAIASDREALIALYYATDGPNWSASTNWLSDKPLGKWYRVGTDELGRVDWLGLDNNGLSGRIPSELGNLTNLGTLGLQGNRLTGPIPSDLGKLTKLTWMSLESNQLSGSIPPELGGLADLQWLYISGNRLTGSIPPELGGLSNLKSLHLSDNKLTGCIPDALRDVPDNDFDELGLPFCPP